MITRIAGTLEGIEDGAATIVPAGSSMAYEVLLPAFLAVELAPATGKPLTLLTLQYLEGQGQGSSFIPRLVGFASTQQRDFFELFTTVSGIGNRKALRAMAQRPGVIARAIHEKDARLLATLPEIGKRMAERVIAELDGKVEAFLAVDPPDASTGDPGVRSAAASGVEIKGGARLTSPAAEEAVLALVALGQTRGEAEDNVARALSRARQRGGTLSKADEILQAVFG